MIDTSITFPNDDQLAKLAVEAMNGSYAPYSRFNVGAALVTHDGSVFLGANVENASYGLTICAERVAVFKAITAGHNHITKIAIAASSGEEVFPCGACRQILNEFGPHMEVITIVKGKTCSRHSLDFLLPKSFGPQNLQNI